MIVRFRQVISFTLNEIQSRMAANIRQMARHTESGAIVTESETRYYISSRKLSPFELLVLTRNEWAVESMHWQLDVIFNEDRTTLHEQNAQKTLNILRKTVLNIVRTFRDRFESKSNMVSIMRNCLFDDDFLLDVLFHFNACV